MRRVENLPEPIGFWEKKRLLIAANHISRSRAAMNAEPEELQEPGVSFLITDSFSPNIC
jgi:hypothetical protein